MVDTNTGCPHCGFTDYDEMEICQACGYLSEDTPVRDISFFQVVKDARTQLQQMGFHGIDEPDDPNDDPADYDTLGNSMYFYYHGDEDLRQNR